MEGQYWGEAVNRWAVLGGGGERRGGIERGGGERRGGIGWEAVNEGAVLGGRQ